MAKRISAIFTLFAFLIFTWSCYSTKVKPGQEIAQIKEDVDILAVQKKSGERIQFVNGYPGKIVNNEIRGTIQTTIEIQTDDIEEKKIDQKGKIIELRTRKGEHYIIKSYETKDHKIIAQGLGIISIPLSDIVLVWVKQIDVPRSILAGVVIASVVGAFIIYLAIQEFENSMEQATSQIESCPFVYSYDGENYVFDGEPYGGSICEGLKRTEWLGLDHLKEVNGQYKLLLTNELEESQHTDELKLVVVDHPQGTKAVPDLNGKIHSITQPLPPRSAHDGRGGDILSLISQKDSRLWLTRTEKKNPEKKQDLKEELIFEFPKPAEAKQAKLVVNAWTSQWGALVAKKFLGLYGNKLPDWYDEVNSFGPAFRQVMNWYQDEELYMLRIQVKTQDGWRVKGTIYGGGPFISKDKAYVLDVSDVPGDLLRIKLTPASTFWMLDYLAVDYTEDLSLSAFEVAAAKAVDKTGLDIRENLSLNDGQYFVMPKSGDYAELTFLALPENPGMERSIILKASGYYSPHLQAEGEPRWDLIRKMQTEPGFTIRYALKEYLKLQKAGEKRLRTSK